ncbi:PREDICTED: uncharacterized protein LOC109125868 [Camelina sativa]|uniref:Uncharacterized protein LOC109125868 n=1 Tax=Camelina sativa TaxID=90675 RepID=A0ABM1QBE9_CAMSA|nr:PREDICTED: uncharacterized protein LOC109125868 [Camelina sativa]
MENPQGWIDWGFEDCDYIGSDLRSAVICRDALGFWSFLTNLVRQWICGESLSLLIEDYGLASLGSGNQWEVIVSLIDWILIVGFFRFLLSFFGFVLEAIQSFGYLWLRLRLILRFEMGNQRFKRLLMGIGTGFCLSYMLRVASQDLGIAYILGEDIHYLGILQIYLPYLVYLIRLICWWLCLYKDFMGIIELRHHFLGSLSFIFLSVLFSQIIECLRECSWVAMSRPPPQGQDLEVTGTIRKAQEGVKGGHGGAKPPKPNIV